MAMSLDERLVAASENAAMASAHHDIWALYIGQSDRPLVEKLIDVAPIFWSYDSLAHRYAFYVRVGALMDRRRGTNSLAGIFREMRNSLGPEDIDRLTKAFERAEDPAKRVRALRNKIYAHQSSHQSSREAYAEAKISLNETGLLVGLYVEIAAVLLRARGLPPHVPLGDHLATWRSVVAAAV
jgi:hypothetical protein